MSNDGTGLRERLKLAANTLDPPLSSEWRPFSDKANAALMREAAEALSAVAPPPEGWVLVPRAMTNAMQIAGLTALDESDVTPEGMGHMVGYKAVREAYAAMLAASPAAPAQPESGDWKAELHEALSEEYSDTCPAPAQPEGGDAVAWMRDSGVSIDEESAAITDRIKRLWLAANPKRVERYTIPLYTRPGCNLPPAGWYCGLGRGHEGPCPAWPVSHETAADFYTKHAATQQAWRCTRHLEDDGGIATETKYAKTEQEMMILRDQGFTCTALASNAAASAADAQEGAK